jgi:ribose/xylose/arabinose/galactoside ABC-type transport system permease subunit
VNAPISTIKAISTPREPRRGVRAVIQLLSPFIGLAVVVIIFSILAPDSFLTTRNLEKVAVQTVVIGLGAIGMTFVIISGGIDLSIGSVIALACTVTGWSLDKGASTPVAVLCGAGAGVACGLVNGLAVTLLRIAPFIVTLGMLGIARGLAKGISGQQPIRVEPEDSSWFSSDWLLDRDWFMIGVALLGGFVLRNTAFGVYTVAIGSNEQTARLCGVPVRTMKVLIYVLCGLFAGLAGVVLFGRLGLGDPTAANGLELTIIAAVVIGGASLTGGEGRILGTIIGVFMLSLLETGCNLYGAANYVQEILIGMIIVIAVSIDSLRHRRSLN